MRERVPVHHNLCPVAQPAEFRLFPTTAFIGLHVLFLTMVLGLTGCSWADKNGTRHVVILGFGMVSFTNQTGAAIQDVRGLGLVFDDAVSIGLVQRHRVEIDPQQASNLVVSISANPFSMSVKNFDMRDLPVAFSETTQIRTNQ